MGTGDVSRREFLAGLASMLPLTGLHLPSPTANPPPASDEIDFLSATALAVLLAKRKISSEEITRRTLTRIEKFNPAINAVVALRPEETLADARRADVELRRSSPRSPLHGVPITVKDMFDVARLPTTLGFADRQSHRPATDMRYRGGMRIVIPRRSSGSSSK